MSIEIPKYVVQPATQQRPFTTRGWLWLSLVGLTLVAFLVGRYGRVDVLQAFQGQKQTLEQRNQDLQTQNESKNKQISRLLTDAKVKEQAIQELKQNIDQLNAEKTDLAADLAFYENLLSRKERIKNLKVFEVKAISRADLIDLKVVLAQKLEKAQIKKGQIELTLIGIKDETGQQINLTKQFQLNDRFEFKYFEILDFTIQLPDGFLPTKLLVKLTGKNLKPKVITEEFQWSKIFTDSLKQIQSAKLLAGESDVQLEKQ